MRRLILTSRYLLLLPVLMAFTFACLLYGWWVSYRRRYAVLTNAPTPAARQWYEGIEREGMAAICEVRHVPGRSDGEIVDNLVRSLDREAA